MRWPPFHSHGEYYAKAYIAGSVDGTQRIRIMRSRDDRSMGWLSVKDEKEADDFCGELAGAKGSTREKLLRRLLK